MVISFRTKRQFILNFMSKESGNLGIFAPAFLDSLVP